MKDGASLSERESSWWRTTSGRWKSEQELRDLWEDRKGWVVSASLGEVEEHAATKVVKEKFEGVRLRLLLEKLCKGRGNRNVYRKGRVVPGSTSRARVSEESDLG